MKRDGTWTDCAPFAYRDHKVINNSQIAIQGKTILQKVPSPCVINWYQIFSFMASIKEVIKLKEVFSRTELQFFISFHYMCVFDKDRDNSVLSLPSHTELTYCAPSNSAAVKWFVLFYCHNIMSRHQQYFPLYLYFLALHIHTCGQHTTKTCVIYDKIVLLEDSDTTWITVLTGHTV